MRCRLAALVSATLLLATACGDGNVVHLSNGFVGGVQVGSSADLGGFLRHNHVPADAVDCITAKAFDPAAPVETQPGAPASAARWRYFSGARLNELAVACGVDVGTLWHYRD